MKVVSPRRSRRAPHHAPRFPHLVVAASLLLLVCLTGPAAAAIGVGLETGIAEASDRNREMRMIGVVATVDLPLRQRLGRHWMAWTQVAGRAGRLWGWGDDGRYAAVGLRLNITAIHAGVSLEGHLGPMTISRDHFGGADFGGNLQMLAQLGFSHEIARGLSFGYRFQHMSNGGIDRSNPGLDSHLFRLETRFGGDQ